MSDSTAFARNILSTLSLEAREFKTPAGRWYLTPQGSDELDDSQRFLSEEQAGAIVNALARPTPTMMAASPPRENAVYARCSEEVCGHGWIVAYLPMELEKAAKLMQRAACPKCANERPTVAHG